MCSAGPQGASEVPATKDKAHPTSPPPRPEHTTPFPAVHLPPAPPPPCHHYATPSLAPQFDTYRAMRQLVGGDWAGSHPATNCLWMSYLAEVLAQVRCACVCARAHVCVSGRGGGVLAGAGAGTRGACWVCAAG